MLDMEEVRRVMCPQVMFTIREEARGFITGRLHDLAMQAGQGLFHQGMPGVVIACQCRLLSHNGVAHRFYPYEGEPSGKRCIVRHGAVVGWHLAR